MIKANELRIGNFVKATSNIINVAGNGNIEVTAEIIRYIQDDNNAFIVYEPIPLSEEWLLRFGFKMGISWFTKYQYPHAINISISHNKCTIGANEEYDVECKHVHHLQNLYFSLTGKELIYE